MKFITPSVQYKQSYLKAIDEGKHETGDTVLSKPQDGQSFEEFVKNKIEET